MRIVQANYDHFVPTQVEDFRLVRKLNSFLRFLLVVLPIYLLFPGMQTSVTAKEISPWETLEPGLALGTFKANIPSKYSDSLIRILRIDPKYFEFKLMNASATQDKMKKSVRDWVEQNGLAAGINASMYQKDFMTSVSLMKTESHVNSSWFSKDNTILVFDPIDKSLPPVQIVDRDCDDFSKIRKQYKTQVQSIRMVSCHQENVWQRQNKIWSTSAIGWDGSGNILFIHVRSPYSPHDLINMLLKLPIGLKRAMYVEGGPDAQMFIHSNKKEYEFIGSYSSGSHESDRNQIGWPVPNVVGIKRKAVK
jgi:hypothetical protein